MLYLNSKSNFSFAGVSGEFFGLVKNFKTKQSELNLNLLIDDFDKFTNLKF